MVWLKVNGEKSSPQQDGGRFPRYRRYHGNHQKAGSAGPPVVLLSKLEPPDSKYQDLFKGYPCWIIKTSTFLLQNAKNRLLLNKSM